MSTVELTLRRWHVPGPVATVLGDRVVLALVAGIVVLGILDRAQLGPSLVFLATAFVEMLPFLVLAVGFAAYAKATGCDALIARAFSGNQGRAVIAASLVGAFSPFCSCGVIPLIAALLAAGVPLAPIMAFWIASPIMDPEMFVLTAAGIGTSFAIAKTVATVGMGLLAGFVTLRLTRLGYFSDVMIAGRSTCGSCSPGVDPNAKPHVAWAFWRESARVREFADEMTTTGWFLAKWLAFAFFLESLMVAYVPQDVIGSFVGEESVFAIPLAVLIGIPSYLNGYAAIPLVSGLIDLGMTPGAAMAFMTAGAVSSIPAAIAVYALVRKPVFALYVALGVIGAVLSGYAFYLAGGPI